MAATGRWMKGQYNPRLWCVGCSARSLLAWTWIVGLLAFAAPCPRSWGAEARASARFHEDIQPFLEDHCYACHGYGMKKGGMSLDPDEYESEDELLRNRDLWWAVLKNVRAGIMPPAKEPRPSDEEKRLLADWI